MPWRRSSMSKTFTIRMIYALFSQLVTGFWGLRPHTFTGSIPGRLRVTFISRPLICQPLDKIPWAPMLPARVTPTLVTPLQFALTVPITFQNAMHQRGERLEVRAVVIVVFDSERWEDSRVGDNSNAVDVVFRSRRCGHCLYDTCGLSKRHWCLLYWSCRNLDVARCRRLGFRIRKSYWKVFRIGTVRYNWPMSAHASQAFSIAHCTDSEDLPSYCLGRPTMVGRPSVLPVVLFWHSTSNVLDDRAAPEKKYIKGLVLAELAKFT